MKYTKEQFENEKTKILNIMKLWLDNTRAGLPATNVTNEECFSFARANRAIMVIDAFEKNEISENQAEFIITYHLAPGAFVGNENDSVWYARIVGQAKKDKKAVETRIAFQAKVEKAGKKFCYRCGGRGGWEGWPGFTCYDCNGKGWHD